MKKALWFDVETTGLDPKKNDIIQLACMVEIDGDIKADFESKIKPFDPLNVEPKALQVNGLKMDDIMKYPEPFEVLKKFTSFLTEYIDPFDKQDKFAPCGFNVQFDIDFLSNFFRKCGSNFYGSFFNYKSVDPLRILHVMDYEDKINLSNYKLSTCCSHFGIKIDAHEALSDIRATKILYNTLRGVI